MGLPFFEKAVGFQKRYGRGHSIGNGLQTNGILIDEHWAKFLNTYNFLVGISLDGPEHIHDHYRLRQNGQGSWSRVVDRAKLLLNSKQQNKFGQMKAALPRDCKECQWLHYCWGGCTKDRLNNPHDKSMNYLCLSYKIFFNHADDQMRKMAEKWKRQQNFAISHQQMEFNHEAAKKIGRNDPCPCSSSQKYKKCCGKIS